MKQVDYETSDYKNKIEVKTFVESVTESIDKFAKTLDNRESELKRINNSIEKKHKDIEKMDGAIADLTNKIEEFKQLKERSNEDLTVLNGKKSIISYNDSDVQKMELDDICSQIASKKSIIAKITTKIDSAKTKIKTDEENKKIANRELRDLEKAKKEEEKNLFRSEELLALVQDIKERLNNRAVEILNDVPEKKTISTVEVTLEPVDEAKEKVTLEPAEETKKEATPEEPVVEFSSILDEPFVEEPVEEVKMDTPIEPTIEPEIEPEIVREIEEPVEKITEDEEGKKEPAETSIDDTERLDSPLLEDILKKDNLSLDNFDTANRNRLVENEELVIKNIEILKKHNVPLEYTVDQSEILYNITSQDLEDLLSIITTDDEGNGMGFTIDYTYNILKELSNVDIDKLIDVYNSEFMNVNAKSGIIGLLKMTNPEISEFAKNRSANIEVLKTLGVSTVKEIVEKYPEFVDIDSPLFLNILNSFDRDDLIKKLEQDVNVVSKILEYWKNN